MLEKSPNPEPLFSLSNPSDAPKPQKRRGHVAKRRKKRRVEKQGYVYFLRAGNSVKIGFSTDVRERFRTLRTACPEPVKIVKIVKGGSSVERAFHKRFAEYRLKGEWFDLRGRMAKYLEMHLKQVELPERVVYDPPDPAPEVMGYL